MVRPKELGPHDCNLLQQVFKRIHTSLNQGPHIEARKRGSKMCTLKGQHITPGQRDKAPKSAEPKLQATASEAPLLSAFFPEAMVSCYVT